MNSSFGARELRGELSHTGTEMHLLDETRRLSVWKIAGQSFPDLQRRPLVPSSCALIGHVSPKDFYKFTIDQPQAERSCGTATKLPHWEKPITNWTPSNPGRRANPFLNGSPAGQDEFLLPLRTNSVTSTLARHRGSASSARGRAFIDVWSNSAQGLRVPELLLTRTARNLPAASVRAPQIPTAPGKATKYPKSRVSHEAIRDIPPGFEGLTSTNR